MRLSTFYVGADRRGLVVVDQNVSGNTDRNLNPTWRQHPPHTRYDLTIAHGQGVVHRDIKPSNVLLDGYGKIKLADFGIASIASASGDPQLTSLTIQLGTPDYNRTRAAGKCEQRGSAYPVCRRKFISSQTYRCGRFTGLHYTTGCRCISGW